MKAVHSKNVCSLNCGQFVCIQQPGLSNRFSQMINLQRLTNKRSLFHYSNVAALLGFVYIFEYFGPEETSLNPWHEYGWPAVLLYACCYLALLGLPQAVFNFLGLVLFPSFPNQPKLKNLSVRTSQICFRVVTRGDYPELVRNNIHRNLNICQDAGLTNYFVEVVTDRSISVVENERIREVVVPSNYKTRSGAMFKARALQYALEDEVNILNDNDWIVHLDEETILTDGSVTGIVNFICDGKHQFGQGVITYVNDGIVNLILTLCDTHRVAEDMGKIQFQLNVLHMPILGWKGSYVVAQAGAERKVSFDHGPDSSVAEDTYFGILAASQGYSFSFIQGDMWEKSPFNVRDFLQQRKRWLQGVLLVAHSSKIPLSYRLPITISIYSWATSPLTAMNVFLQPLFPLDTPRIVNYCNCFVAGVWIYMYVYGTLRSFNVRRVGAFKVLMYVLMGIVITPVKILIEILAVMWGLVTPKHKFFVVKKGLTDKV